MQDSEANWALQNSVVKVDSGGITFASGLSGGGLWLWAGEFEGVVNSVFSILHTLYGQAS